MAHSADQLRELAVHHGQEHVFAFWDQLSSVERDGLLAQLADVDFEQVAQQAALLQAPPASEQGSGELTPPELFPLQRDAQAEAAANSARELGAARLAEGKVAFLLVAGGQASRLGYDGPKGAFPVGPVSGRSLFELHARRLRAAQERSRAKIEWYVMTSPANDQTTREFFAGNDHFGLDPDQLAFFQQAMIPAVDLQGRILMSSTSSLFLAPNGHGGTLAALQRAGLVERAQERGIETFSYFQVDNPLVRPADTLFLGLHARAGARMSSKVVAKRDGAEKVGVIGYMDGQLGCIEYSDLPANLREATDDEGRLLFGAGNIAAHLLEVDFVDELTRDGLELPWHVARKRMQVIGSDGQSTETDGAKFETFIFDALGQSPVSVTLEVERGHEFSPVKNPVGVDSAESARRDLCKLFGDWATAAGRDLPEPDAAGNRPVEICPLVAEDLETFVRPPVPEPRVLADGHLYDPR